MLAALSNLIARGGSTKHARSSPSCASLPSDLPRRDPEDRELFLSRLRRQSTEFYNLRSR
jgi:hypothetical protein